MKERMARMEETIAQICEKNQHQLSADQTSSQYESTEQLVDDPQPANDLTIDHSQASAADAISFEAIMKGQRSSFDEEDEDFIQRDPFKIPDEEEFFLARQTFRATVNQSEKLFKIRSICFLFS